MLEDSYFSQCYKRKDSTNSSFGCNKTFSEFRLLSYFIHAWYKLLKTIFKIAIDVNIHLLTSGRIDVSNTFLYDANNKISNSHGIFSDFSDHIEALLIIAQNICYNSCNVRRFFSVVCTHSCIQLFVSWIGCFE